MFYLNKEMSYEEMEAELQKINYLLDKNPRNKILYYEKAKYFYFVFFKSPTRLFDERNHKDLYNILFEMFSMILPLDEVRFDIWYSYCSLLYYTKNYQEFLLNVETREMISMLQLPNCEIEYNMCCDLLFLLVVTNSRLGKKDKVIELLPICKQVGVNFSEEIAQWYFLFNEKDLCKTFFTENGNLRVSVIHQVLDTLPDKYVPERIYKEELININMKLEHMMYLGMTGDILDTLNEYEKKNGMLFITRIYAIWLKNGSHYSDYEKNIENLPFHFPEILSYVKMEQYQSFIHKLLTLDVFAGHRDEFFNEIVYSISNMLTKSGDSKTAFSKLRFAYLYVISIGNGGLAALIFAMLCRISSKNNLADVSEIYGEAAYQLCKHIPVPFSKEINRYQSWASLQVVCVTEYAATLLKSRKYSKAINMLVSVSVLTKKVEDYKVVIRYYKIKKACFDGMEEREQVLRCYDEMLINTVIPDSDKIKIRKEKEEYFSLWFTKSTNIIYRNLINQYECSYMKIPQSAGMNDIYIQYTSYHELYDNLLIRWKAYLRDRDKIKERDIGIHYFQKAASIHERLVTVAIDIGAQTLAVKHIEDFRGYDLAVHLCDIQPISDNWNESKILDKCSDRKIISLEFYYSSKLCFCFVCDEQHNKLVQTIQFPDVNESKIQAMVENLYGNNNLYECIEEGFDGLQIKKSAVKKFNTWIEEFDRIFFEPINSVLETQNIEKLVVIPFRCLHRIPWGVLGYSYGKDLCLTSRYCIVYSPSRKIKDMLCKRKPASFPEKALLVANSLDKANDEKSTRFSLKGAEWELIVLNDILHQHGIKTLALVREAALHREVSENITAANLIHIGCHGIYLSKYPEKSGILLHTDQSQEGAYIGQTGEYKNDPSEAVGRILSLEELWKSRENKKLYFVNLSCCNLGKNKDGRKSDETDEFISFVNGFLYVGAYNVVASSSVINDAVGFVFNQMLYYYCFDTGFQYAKALKKTIYSLIHMDISEARKLLDKIKDREVRNQMNEYLVLLCQLSEDNQHPFENPIVWCNFKLYGAGD